ncbi:MAG: hypothetical protein CM15mP117_14570 [Alphaproteobacteria bacterium]|nr:MAG: hypothetical protein CM15mP117_14570 [Alphaproteobacteria bacterium]
MFKGVNHISLIVFIFLFLGMGIYYTQFSTSEIVTNISLKPNDAPTVNLGGSVYAKNCASCHGANLEGQFNWRQRDSNGYLPAPPHDESGHTWHHSDQYLFLMTKYGIEEMIGKRYPNNMPAYKDVLTDDEIIAVLSYIKSTWPEQIKQQHNMLNSR